MLHIDAEGTTSRLIDLNNEKQKRESIAKDDKDRPVLVSHTLYMSTVSEKELCIIFILYNMILFCAGANVRTNEINRLYDKSFLHSRSWFFSAMVIVAVSNFLFI